MRVTSVALIALTLTACDRQVDAPAPPPPVAMQQTLDAYARQSCQKLDEAATADDGIAELTAELGAHTAALRSKVEGLHQIASAGNISDNGKTITKMRAWCDIHR